MRPTDPTIDAMLKRELVADASRREAAIAITLASIAGFGTGMIFTQLDAATSLRFSWWLIVVIAYEMAVLGLALNGRWSPWLAWVSSTVEIAVPMIMFGVTAGRFGPADALAPTTVMWALVISGQALRMDVRVAVWAAGVAVIADLAAWYFWVRPAVGVNPTPMLTLQGAVVRAAMLAGAGALAVAIIRYARSKSRDAIAAIRSKDLMSKYVIQEPLGQGGAAEVFRAIYTPEGGFEKVVVIKRVRKDLGDDPNAAKNLVIEAKVGASLHHPNVVQVLDFGRFDGHYVMALEYVDGVSLSMLLRAIRRPLQPAAVAYLAAELCDALDYIHRRRGSDGTELGLVHRDLNPPNILISMHGEVKLSDFGIAAAVSAQPNPAGVPGKPGYFAPEQARGEPIDGRADLFALGVTMHEALTGELLFHGDTEQLMVAAMSAPITPPPEAPHELSELVMQLLDRDPSKRGVAGVMRARLTSLTGESEPLPRGRELLVRAVRDAKTVQALPADSRPTSLMR